jgi:SagB-type dehydrogenase family enzyme
MSAMGWLRRKKRKNPSAAEHGRPTATATGEGSGSEPDAAERNAETDRLYAYHAATKHTYASVHGSGWSLDWKNQPNPFRRYDGAPRTELPPPAPLPKLPASACMSGLADEADHAWPERALPLISSLLHHSMAVSAWKQVLGTDVRYSLRVNPSSGNLHPTETWLALRGFTDVEDGLYHYDVRAHALEQRRAGDAANALAALSGLPPLERGALIVLGSIFWRESWKYRARAYRYCLHDMGHAAASVALAARGLGLGSRAHGHFPDQALEAAMALTGGDERPLLLLDLTDGRVADAEQSEPAAALGAPAGTPNVLSEHILEWPLIDGMHHSTLVDGGACPQPLATPDARDEHADPAEPIELPPAIGCDTPLDEVVRSRRSALDYLTDGRATLSEFASILHEATRHQRADMLGTLDGGAPRRLVSLYCYVHRVDDLPPGCYRYLPVSHALLPVRLGNVQDAAAGLSLGQELAGHAIAAFSMIADLERGAAAFGNRAYRYAHIEAGMIGQGLYLAATARGIQSTGIGAFYDEDVQRWLGLAGRERQVIYHHSIGKAALDPRLIDSDQPVEARDEH